MHFLEGVHRACWNGFKVKIIIIERYQKDAAVTMLFLRSVMAGAP
jgi:hypothetical protein